MRVISGIYGGRVLRGPSDLKTRPTSDRLRETLFNIIGPRIGPATRFLDLCAGTGAVGIEACSRGAGFIGFVDRSRRACGLIEKNLDGLGIEEDATGVFCAAAVRFLCREMENPWDIIFYDPPYGDDHLPVLLALGGESKALGPEAILIVEHHSKSRIPDAAGELRRWRLVKQGESCLSFFEEE